MLISIIEAYRTVTDPERSNKPSKVKSLTYCQQKSRGIEFRVLLSESSLCIDCLVSLECTRTNYVNVSSIKNN